MNALRPFTILTAGLLLAGVGMVGYSIALACQTAAFVCGATTTAGRVVQLEWRGGARAPRAHGPAGGYLTVFTFTDHTGRTHTVKSKEALSPPPFREGDAVKVLFQREAPDQARIQSFRMLWFLPMVLAVLGLVFGGTGALFYVAGRKP